MKRDTKSAIYSSVIPVIPLERMAASAYYRHVYTHWNETGNCYFKDGGGGGNDDGDD